MYAKRVYILAKPGQKYGFYISRSHIYANHIVKEIKTSYSEDMQTLRKGISREVGRGASLPEKNWF